MSGQPDLCVDIFSQMANLLANFNNNLANGNSEVFSHTEGFSQSTNAMGQSGEPVSFEDQVNQCAQWVAIGSMLLFLMYSHFSGALQNGTQMKASRNNRNDNDDGSNPPGDVY